MTNIIRGVKYYFGVLQGSILGPLLFDVFICDMFYFLEDFDITNYAGDSIPYNADKNIEFVVNNLGHSLSILSKWLNSLIYIKINTHKSHLLVSGNVELRLLGITIDSNLTFEKHINVCKRGSQRRQVHPVYHGTESLSFLGPKIWDLVPWELKHLERREVFQIENKQMDSL